MYEIIINDVYEMLIEIMTIILWREVWKRIIFQITTKTIKSILY